MQKADWEREHACRQVNKVNILVKCANRLVEDLKLRDWESFRAFHNNINLVYPPICMSAVCVCCCTMTEKREHNVVACVTDVI